MVDATQSAIPAAAPDETKAASLCVSSAIRSPTLRFSSNISTNCVDAALIAATTSGGMSDPPSLVRVAAALMTGRTPSCWGTDWAMSVGALPS